MTVLAALNQEISLHALLPLEEGEREEKLDEVLVKKEKGRTRVRSGRGWVGS